MLYKCEFVNSLFVNSLLVNSPPIFYKLLLSAGESGLACNQENIQENVYKNTKTNPKNIPDLFTKKWSCLQATQKISKKILSIISTGL